MKLDNNALYDKFITELDSRFSLAGKLVLDLGCGSGEMVKNMGVGYGVKQVIGIDLFTTSETGENYCIVQDDVRNLPFDDSSFDLIYARGTFEHMHDLQTVVSEIRRVLKPRGKFFTNFSPIWTGIIGNHCYCYGEIIRPGEIYDEEIVWAIPPWGHLYMTKEEMAEHLSEHLVAERVKKAVELIYDSPILNRYSASHIKDIIMHSGMIVRLYEEYVMFSRAQILKQRGDSELTADIIKKIIANKYNPEDIGINGMQLCLEKYESLNW